MVGDDLLFYAGEAMTFLTLADAVALLQRPDAPKRVDTLVTGLPDKAPCAFCGQPTKAAYRFGKDLGDEVLPADVNCRFAFQQQADPLGQGNPVWTVRVINVLENGVSE